MSQTLTPPPGSAPAPGRAVQPSYPGQPATPPGAPAATQAEERAARRAGVRSALRRSPGKLRIALALCVLAAVVFGALGFQAARVQGIALDDARADTSQLLGVQDVRNNLVVADAAATNAFLVGGLEPVDQRERYDDAIANASIRIAELAGSNSADATELGRVASQVAVYTGLIEQARANNRQGFPVGSAYLDQASTLLRDEILPTLTTLVDDNADRVASDLSMVRNALWILAAGILCLALLVATQVWLAKRTHRVLNVGLLAASAVVLVVGVVGAVLLSQTNGAAAAVRDGPYAATLAASTAYSEANDAKAMESFTLIKRGSGQAYEESFVELTADATQRLDDAGAAGVLDGTAAGHLGDWVTQHQAIRALDDAGDWDGAVALATSSAEGSPNAAFAAFSQSVTNDITDNIRATQADLASAGTKSALAGWLLLAAGLVAAVLAWRGLNVRLEEYR
ncbi:hypothetical protein [Oerskovia paurometabola]|uniref:hypothetical protein n=1 Tax=Oerskovia paurometabola TaxID=162170 RepID=UPI003416E85F